VILDKFRHSDGSNDVSYRQDLSVFFGQCMPHGSVIRKLKAFDGYTKLMKRAYDMLEGWVIGVSVWEICNRLSN
jgi:hypothetical protein